MSDMRKQQIAIGILLERIERLEAIVLNQNINPIYVAHTAGCVCPVGAELACGNAFCPRNAVVRHTRTTDGTAT